jgi:hypothetical protein
MDTIAIVLIVVLVVAAAAVAVVLAGARRRAGLQQRFGPEYERVVGDGENRREAEAELRGRVAARDELDIKPLSDTDRASYKQRWDEVQAAFVDRPDSALTEADQLVEALMRDRGYPVDDFERQADLVSVDHPQVVSHYREAHGVFSRVGDGEVDTEAARQALVSYRALFAELLAEHGATTTDATDTETETVAASDEAGEHQDETDMEKERSR